jgi:hypothetical protein
MIYNSPAPPPEREAYSVPAKASEADARNKAAHSSNPRMVFRCIFFPQKRSVTHQQAARYRAHRQRFKHFRAIFQNIGK